jgi:hypothetical protein
MKARKSTTNSTNGVSKAPNFDEVVSSLKKQGITAIRKRKFRLLGDEKIPDFFLGPSFDLSEPQVKRPDFWVPIGFDGSAWQVFLCVPPWMKKGSVAAEWYLTWRDGFRLDSSEGLLEDPEDFIRSTLDQLAMPDSSIWRQDGMSERETSTYEAIREEAHALLSKAMQEAKKLDQNASLTNSASIEADSAPPLSGQIAMAVELAFRAGQLSERGAWYGRSIPTVARKGMPLVHAQKTNTGPRLRWTQKAEELMRENPAISTKVIALRLKDAEVVFTTDNWETVDFEDGTPSKSFAVFSRAVSRIRSRLKKL